MCIRDSAASRAATRCASWAADCFAATFGVPRFAVVLASLVVTAPPSLFRTMDTLKATSTIAVMCMLAIVALVVLMGFGPSPWLEPCPGKDEVPHGHCQGHVEPVTRDGLHVFCAIPFFVNAFTCQQNAFIAVGELARPTPGRQTAVGVRAPVLALAAGRGCGAERRAPATSNSRG